MPPRKKQCVSNDELDLESIIQNYLAEQYKPFAINDIVNNLQKDYKVSKPNALKALEKLSNENKIVSKTFGKVTIYCCKEQKLDLPKGIKPEECSYEVVTELRDEYRVLEKERSELVGKLNNLNNDPSNNEILDVINQHRAQLSEIEEHIKSVEENWDPENEAKIDDLKRQQIEVEKEIRKRNKMIMTLLSVIKEAGVVSKGETMDDFLVCIFKIQNLHFFILRSNKLNLLTKYDINQII